MSTSRPARLDAGLSAVILVAVVVPLLAIASIIAVQAWRPLSTADRALLVGCAAGLVAVAVVAHKAKIRDPSLRSLLLQLPMVVGVYALTHDPLSPVVYGASSLSIVGLIRWCGRRP